MCRHLQVCVSVTKYREDRPIDRLGRLVRQAEVRPTPVPSMEHQWKTNRVSIDAFPDELLLMVLSHIDDGLTLLDVVPLVCKRWHRLSREPAAWRSATVVITGCLSSSHELMWDIHHHDKILSAARVLVHAPALRHVCFGWSCAIPPPLSCSYDKEIMTSALVRSRAEVREIVFPQPMLQPTGWKEENPVRFMERETVALLFDFLSRNSSHVRYLKVGLMLGKGKQQLLRALSRCENLEALHLMLPNGFFYLGELRGRRIMPKLKRLTLVSWSPPFQEGDCQAFLRDLVCCVAQSVRHVRCEKFFADVLAELSPCVELRSLHCHVEGEALAKTLTRLRHLSLEIPYDGLHRVWYTADRALRACAELQDLCELRLHSTRFVGDGEHSQALSCFLTTLGTKSPNLTRLSICSVVEQLSPETVRGFFKPFPRLESVHIDHILIEYLCFWLPELAEVGCLKRLSGKIICWKRRVQCRAAIEQFKLQRPEVDCRLSFSS